MLSIPLFPYRNATYPDLSGSAAHSDILEPQSLRPATLTPVMTYAEHGRDAAAAVSAAAHAAAGSSITGGAQ